MKFLTSVVLGLALPILPAFAFQGAAAEKQPVVALLYSRFDDHVMMPIVEQRLFRLMNLVEKLRKDYPGVPVAVSCEFTGSVALKLNETPTGQDYIKRLRELAKTGAISLGYIGEPQPPERDQAKLVLKDGLTPEQRWQEQIDFADHALSEYRDFLAGKVEPGRAGGFRAMREAFGDPEIMGVFTPQLGGEAPYFHLLRRINLQPLVPGLPDPYFTMNIHGFRTSATDLGKGMAPVPQSSPELFWDSGFLRASFTDSNDIRGLSADEGKAALEKFMQGLDRSHVRLLQIEVCGYARYLAKWPDGTPKLRPLAWAYEHPDDPFVPGGVRAFTQVQELEQSYEAEEAALAWLIHDFLPANPRSRLVRPGELRQLARTPVNSDIPADALTEAVKDWVERTSKEVNMSATWVRGGGSYFSAADLFQMLASSLAETSQSGRRPDKVRLTHIGGPIRMDTADETFPNAVVSARDVMRVAASLAPKLNDQTWRAVPSNAVPVRVEIAGKRLIPAQFLALMVDAYLAPSPDTQIKVRYFQPFTAPGAFFPRQNRAPDAGHVWALRPAPLNLD